MQVFQRVPEYLLEIPRLQARIRGAAQRATDLDALKQHLVEAEELAANACKALDGADDPSCTALVVEISAAVAVKGLEPATWATGTGNHADFPPAVAGTGLQSAVLAAGSVSDVESTDVKRSSLQSEEASEGHSMAVKHSSRQSGEASEGSSMATGVSGKAGVVGPPPKVLADKAFVVRPADAAQSPDAKLAKMHRQKPAPGRGPLILRLKKGIRNLLKTEG